jgi:hypothetical protein
MKLKEEIGNIVGEWLCQQQVSICDDRCDILVKRIMRVINKRANEIDVGEMIKSLMWNTDKRKALSYGDISEYVEKGIREKLR